MASTNNTPAVNAEAPVNNVQTEQEQTETEQTTNSEVAVNSDLITGLSQGLNATATSIIIAIVLVLLVGLAISITVTIFGHKARVKCVGNSKFGFYSPLIITFLILMWLGNVFPPFGFFVTLVGLIGAVIMIVLANKNCKK
jgi:hypothetical protein